MLEWSPAGGADKAYYWLSLAQMLPAEQVISNISATIDPILGDLTPMTLVEAAVVDLGPRELLFSPGFIVLDPGPRIQVRLTGGTVGLTYGVRIKWSDSTPQDLTRVVNLLVEW